MTLEYHQLRFYTELTIKVNNNGICSANREMGDR